ncbi:hypothetical protein [Pseudomonas sp.]|uniref:hypothetical protein n=1 Tax=Pseudomonas sp. TaxID=306 RepID=UPI003D0FD57F
MWISKAHFRHLVEKLFGPNLKVYLTTRRQILRAKKIRISGELYTERSDVPVSLPSFTIIRDKKDGGRRFFRRDKLTALTSAENGDQKLLLVEQRVRKYCIDSLDHSWDDLYLRVSELIKHGESANDMADRPDWAFKARSGRGQHAEYFAPALAIAYYIEGRELLAAGHTRRAQRCVREALKWSSTRYLLENPKAKRTLRARNAGIAKGKKSDPVKDEVIRQLSVLAPVEGWFSRSQAVEAMSKSPDRALLDLRAVEAGLNQDAIFETITSWLAEDERVMAAFHDLKSKQPVVRQCALS